MKPDKNCFIIAGPNGAGKTTFARDFLPKEGACINYINADLIASGLSPFAPENANVAASKIMLREIARCVEGSRSFSFETTLSGVSYVKKIQRLFGKKDIGCKSGKIGVFSRKFSANRLAITLEFAKKYARFPAFSLRYFLPNNL